MGQSELLVYTKYAQWAYSPLFTNEIGKKREILPGFADEIAATQQFVSKSRKYYPGILGAGGSM